ncbi:MAG TPA: MFS transporter [Clostridiales bacterium]|nr:MFS transporter [Clostridiales bacterium]
MQEKPQIKVLGSIPLTDKIGYGAGNLTFGVILQIISTYMVFYSTVILNIPGSVIGFVIGASVFWDAVSDPIMGHISDHTHSVKYGRRHLYILSGSIAIAITNFFLWDIDPHMPLFWKTAIIITLLILVKAFTTIYSVPHTALGAELTDDYNERSSIQGIRTVFFVLGLFSANVMGMFLFFRPTPEYPQGQLNPAAYRDIGITASVVALIFGLICYFTTKKYIPFLSEKAGEDSNKHGIKELFQSIVSALANADYRYVVLGYMFTNIASALIGAIGMHVFTYTFRFGNYGISLIFGVLFGISILSQPVWVKISSLIDKKPAVLLGLGASAAGAVYFLILVFLRESVAGQAVWFLPFAALSGFGMGGLFTMPLSMIADTIDVEELASGSRKEGIFYGCLTLCYKLSQSAAIFILGVFLDLVNFNSELTVQPKNTVLALGLILALGCILSILAAMICYRRYSLNQSKIEHVQQQLKHKRQ